LDPADLAAILEAGRWTGSSKNVEAGSSSSSAPPPESLATAGDYTDPIRNAAAALP
jgi:hypothetical protein